jgi:prevent-host-death family protein
MAFTSPFSSQTPSLNISEARDKLMELTERAHYRFEQFRITRHNKPLARIVSDEYMQVIDQLIEADAGLADTIALMLNQDALNAIKESMEAVQRGEIVSMREFHDRSAA